MTAPAIAVLVATIFAGGAAGVLYLQRQRRKWLTNAHLLLALTSAGLVGWLVATAPDGVPGPPGAVPVALLGFAVAAGWLGPRLARRGGVARALLPLHVASGLAGFLFFLAWGKGL
ncbi:MAG: hypothetical protein K2X11_19305 [Acetobacteraceae bacterium]|nr:hypothetical protein [Acetobacteraceae bacterium]